MKVAFARPGHVSQPNVRRVALVVPMIVAIGSMLSCLDGEAAEAPEHAYITYGDSWKCERGFKRAEDECQSIQVPEHAYLDYSGNNWVCDHGFKREGNRCSPE